MKFTSSVDVVTIGESMVLFQQMDHGSLTYAPLFNKSIAGAESNVAIGLTRLGKKVRWISRLGQDPFGNYILSILKGEGIDTSKVVRDETAPSAICFKEYKGYGDPIVYYYRMGSAASLMTVDDVEESWFEGARHLHVTGITPAIGSKTTEVIRKAMLLAREMGMSISFDPNIRQKLWSANEAREVILSLIPLCDIFLPGINEAEFLVGSKSEDQYASIFMEMGAKLVAIKLGENGSIGFCKEGSVISPPFPMQSVIDTVGAGDAFAAGLLSILIDQNDPMNTENIMDKLRIALVRANIMGALVTQFKGDWEGLPYLSELENYMVKQQSIAR